MIETPLHRRWYERNVTLKDAVILEVTVMVFTVILFFFIFALVNQGQSQLAESANRNGALTVAAEKGLRCILKSPDIPQQGPKRQEIFDRCYREFDALIAESESPT